MKLDEMLEHTGAAYLDDRTKMLEGDDDNLWSDETLVRFFNEAQRILCRRAWCIIDEAQAQAGVIVLRTGVKKYDLHKSVLRVYTATPEDQDYPLTRHDSIALRTPRPYSSDIFPMNTPTSATPGRPLGCATDSGTRSIEVYPAPSSTENGLRVLLKVARLPVCWLDVGKTDDSPEVPEDYHLPICDYSAGRCLTMPNVDSANKADGRELLKNFDALVWEARRDRQRAERSDNRWGFASTTAL